MAGETRKKTKRSDKETALDVAPAVAGDAATASALAAEATAEKAAESAATASSAGDLLLTDWQPLGQCLDLRIGQSYWSDHAASLFAQNRVPTLVHDSGTLSRRAARVLFAWCGEQAARGTLPAEIVLVEVGMGTGLHLRYLLDTFRDLCAEAGVPWYDSLLALGTDVSVTTVRKAKETGLFAAHGARVRLGYIDILRPNFFAELETGAEIDLNGRVQVMLANYVLDVLPVDIFRRVRADGELSWEAVLVRTWLRDPQLLPAYTDLTLDQVKAAASDGSDAAAAQLSEIYSLLQLELRAWPVDVTEHPDLPELHRVADAQEAALGVEHPLFAHGTVVNHSAGPMRAIQLLAQTLSPNGYAVFRDVAMNTPELAAQPRTYQKYGAATAAGLNFLQLDGFFAGGSRNGLQLIAPLHDGVRNQSARLCTFADLPDTAAAFQIAFDGADMLRATQMGEQAQSTENPQQAIEIYRQALQIEPTNWSLMADAAHVALTRAKSPGVALAIARKALGINTEYSADLWLVFGDAHYALGSFDEAVWSYKQGLKVQPKHPRLHYSVAWVETERGRFANAFEHIGLTLANDPAGDFRAEALQLLDLCLRAQSGKHAAEEKRLAERNNR